MPEPLSNDPHEEALEQPYFPMDPDPSFLPAPPDSNGNPAPTLNEGTAVQGQS